MAAFFKGAPPVSRSTYDLADPLSPRTQVYRQRHKNERRRSSVGDVSKAIASKASGTKLTPFQRRELARQARLEEEKRKKEEAEKKLEEKRIRAKKLKETMKNKDLIRRVERSNKYIINKDGLYGCNFCGNYYNKNLIEEHFITHPTMIRDRIWLGNGINACDINIIKSLQITHILNCTKEVALPKNISKLLVNFKRLPLIDKNSENLLTHLINGLYFIDDSLSSDVHGHRILIHCKQGVSRSVSLVCSYLMWKEGLSFNAALGDIQSKRHIACPNDKFSKQLKEFEGRLKSGSGSGGFIREVSGFKLGKFNSGMYEDASKRYIELKLQHPDVKPSLKHVRSNSMDRASVIISNQGLNGLNGLNQLGLISEKIDMLDTPYDSENDESHSASSYNDLNVNEVNEMKNEDVKESNSGSNSGNSSTGSIGYKSKTFKLGMNDRKNRRNDRNSSNNRNNRNNKSRASKSPKRDKIDKNDKNDKNRSKDKEKNSKKNGKTSSKSPKPKTIETNNSNNSNNNSNNNSSKKKKNKSSKNKKIKTKNKNKNKINKTNNNNNSNIMNRHEFNSINRKHRRSSVSVIETPKSPTNKFFDLEFNIDSDLQHHDKHDKS